MAHHALPAVRQPLSGDLVEKHPDLRLERRGEHPSRTFPRDLGERVFDGFRLTEPDDAGIVLHGVSLLLEVLAGFDTRHDTPPHQLASPKFGHSSGPAILHHSPGHDPASCSLWL